MEKATFGAGCFWGVEEAFRRVPGVVDTLVGYAGGDLKNPSYEQVCAGRTGHAEVVQVTYDPEKVSYNELLDIFWKSHDPTQLDRQGPDVGSQYRSVIFYHTDEQKRAAFSSKKELNEKYKGGIVTEIVEAGDFYKAEDYHQKYLAKRGMSSCTI